MSHIAFCMPAAAGHVNPTLGVAAELIARGHRVSYAAIDEYADRITEIGAEFVPYRSTLAGQDLPTYTSEDMGRVMGSALRESKAVLPQVLKAYRGDEPDFVVYDSVMGWWGRLLAARWRVPFAVSWPTLVSNEHWSLNEYVKVDLDSTAVLAFGLRLSLLAAKHRLSLGNLLEGKDATAHLVFVPKAFQFCGDTFGDRYEFVGPALSDRAFQGEWRPPADRQVVLVSLGTAYHDRVPFFRTCIEALAGSGKHVVLAVGGTVDIAELGEIPPGVEVHETVPQLQVLQHASAFVSHAGMNSTMESLSFGVPLVAVPQMPEQAANADRVAQLGLGRHLPPDEVTAGALRTAVDEVCGDDRIAENLRTMRAEIEAAGGAKAAADILEDLVPAQRDRHTTR
ncbi:macrolide family glycosyltransferase [Amycolatopsis sp. CA-230715]|uniref:macrolide family glycosyltransferase n=1 Tax=Amycolatopsis sp. CA-230715 TaxID=2745196 RepID=UPI001C024413|nr:macrolide family glycosyltransferase [Amycolatopsis sp. CA-230715]QWF78558.1 Demethyllactenocin mycarosyltransferase [Amycolatopsis sp. CA-230715]